MLPELGTKEFTKYLQDIGRADQARRHKFYGESVEHMKEMGIHVTGDDPKKLLDIKRPNENEEAKKYRLDSYKPKTKASASKAASIINRIYNERLFSITFSDDPSGRVPEGESLQKYLNKKMPIYVSLMNYIKTVFTRMHLKDANAVLGILPTNFDIEDTEFFTPIPIFYTSDEVVDFEDEEHYTILRGGMDKDAINQNQEIIIYTRQQILVFSRDRRGDDFTLKFEFTHGFGIPPAFRVGGIVTDTQPPQLFESFIAGVLPHWDDAVAMFSDLQAAIVNHLYPEKWEFTVDCDDVRCRGTGRIDCQDASGNTTDRECPTCHGSGKKTTKGPYSVYQVNKDALNPDAPLPTPPFGYGEKELDSTELLVRLAESEIQKGFAAINMDIVNQVGENQSGIAKVIDRQDLDGFLGAYSDHLFKYVIPRTVLFIEMWRYWELFDKNEEWIQEYFPEIKGPTTFDVFSISLLTDEFSKLSESGVSGTFLVGLQKDIIDKRFSDEFTKTFFNTIIDVDPIAHLNNEDIMTQGRVIGQTEMYIHTYAKDLVEEAQGKDKDFLQKPLLEKKEIIRNLAEEKQKERLLKVQQIPVEPNV